MVECCLTIICPLAVEEKLLDILLATSGCERFTSAPCFSHGAAPGRLNVTEQVMGRSAAAQITVLLDAATLDRVRDVLRREFTSSGTRYWVTRVTDAIVDGEKQ